MPFGPIVLDIQVSHVKDGPIVFTFHFVVVNKSNESSDEGSDSTDLNSFGPVRIPAIDPVLVPIKAHLWGKVLTRKKKRKEGRKEREGSQQIPSDK